jgi:hypothetical protein
MKKSIFLLSIIAAIVLTSCGGKENYKMHARVGEILEDGVIFYVSENESYALICSFTDLQAPRPGDPELDGYVWDLGEYKWSDFARDTFLQKDTTWNVTSPTDSTIHIDSTWFFGFIGATSEDDGEANTEKIAAFKYPKNLGVNAAKECREYFLGTYVLKPRDRDTATWRRNKGKWYLPAMQEGRYLAYAKERVNEKMANYNKFYPDSGRIKNAIDPWGWEPLMNCYWTSTELNARSVYYKCVDGENQSESYDPKNNSKVLLSIRPVRKVSLR